MTFEMAAVTAIFLATYFVIATELLDKTAAAMLGVGLVLALRLSPYDALLAKVDLNVVFLLVGMMIVVNIMSHTGLFEWGAVTIARGAKGNGLAIVLLLLFVTMFLSAFLDNVTTIILIAPITILVTQILDMPPVPVLALEAICSNVGGAATMIGDPPNILIGSRAGLSFNSFIINLGPVVLIVALVFLVVIAVMFRKSANVSDNAKRRLAATKPEKAIVEPLMLRRSLLVFAIILAGFFFSYVIHMEPGIVALCGAFLMASVCRIELHEVVEKVEWNTILFFVGLFMLIGALEHNGLFQWLGGMMLSATNGHLAVTALAILWCSAIMSAIVDNIPLVMAMIPLIKSVVPVFAAKMGLDGSPEAVMAVIEAPLFWALALGACLGGNGTLIGASANVVVSQIANRNKFKMTFWQFTRYGFPLMVLSLVISSAYLYLRYFRV